jgi:hypothetical protein
MLRTILDFIFDWLLVLGVPILIGAWFALLSDEFKRFKGARVCLYIATVWAFGKVLMWSAFSSDKFPIRALIVFFAFGIIGLCLSEALRLTTARERAATAASKTEELRPVVKPDLSIRLVYPNAFALIIHNDSTVLAREAKYWFGIWNLDHLDVHKNCIILPIPSAEADWIKPGETAGPVAVLSLPTVAPLIKPKDRLFGFIGLNCPECVSVRTYFVYAVSGEGGWYYRIPDGQTLMVD